MTVDTGKMLKLNDERADELRSNRMDDADARSVAYVAKGLADPVRVHIADVLSEAGELCVNDLAQVVGRVQNLVSHHLRILHGAELVEVRRDRKLAFYSLTPLGTALLDALAEPAA